MPYWWINDANNLWYWFYYFSKHLDWAEENSENKQYCNPINKEVKTNKTIFVYWKQGFENAPELVKKCLKSVRLHKDEYDLVELTAENLHDYIQLPDYIEKLHDTGKINEANYSDIVRNNLLVRYGGFWFDATCYLSGSIPSMIADSEFFMYNRDLLEAWMTPLENSSWFIKSNQGNVLLVKLQNFLFSYFKHYDHSVHYFIYHLLLSILVNYDNTCKQVWDDKPYICSMNPHLMLKSFQMPYTTARYQNILNTSIIHKLTYKYDKALLESKEENILEHFMNNN